MITTRRQTAGILAAILAATLVGACNPDRTDDAGGSPAAGAVSPVPSASGGGPESGAPAASGSGGGALEATGSLTTMGFGYETGDEIAQVRVDTFKEAYPDVTLEVAEGSFDEQAFLSAVAAGDPPDLVYLDRNLVGTYAARGAITPLSDCVARAPIDMSAYRESAVAQVTLDGVVYAIPEFFNTRLLMIDGAGRWSRFRHVTLPMISGALFFTLIVNVIASLQIFSEVWTMYFGNQDGGAGQRAALFYVIYLFQQGFQFLHMGYASAMAWLLFVVIVVLTAVQLRLSRRWVYYEGGR